MGKSKVTLVEVGLRDGLQSEKITISVSDRVKLAKMLTDCGLSRIELGSFVREDWVPPMTGTRDIVLKMLQWQSKQLKAKNTRYSVLVPNLKGLEEAIETEVEEIAIFASVTEGFSRANLNASRKEAFLRFQEVAKAALKKKIKVRGYLSVCFGCPFEGAVAIKEVVRAADSLLALGCYEISIGDTIGVAGSGQVKKVFAALQKVAPLSKFAGHFHDTRGQALANVLTAYDFGVRVFDASFGGLGGCPYAPTSTGNVATEELVYLFDSLGVQTGVDLKGLNRAGQYLANVIQRPLPSRLWRAGQSFKVKS